ncbi:hypothetical protein LZ023_23185 [Pseudomonas silvicola]|nr:hypothetical protein LZ023_23185 [Pseudomonas silvicola]
MHKLSENWHLLKTILDGRVRHPPAEDPYSYAAHVQASAKAIFLANASLATPQLSREVVEQLLSGELWWPSGSPSARTPTELAPLATLERFGVVAFYANWCSLHCDSLRKLDDIDPSLQPLVNSIHLLQAIISGSNGFLRPDFRLPAPQLDAQLASKFSSQAATEVLPQLSLHAGYYHLTGDGWSPLDSTHLWMNLRETLSAEEAMQRWLLCQRVICAWATPVLFEHLEYEERFQFENSLLAYLADDPALGGSLDSLYRQMINRDRFSSLLCPVEIHIHTRVDADGTTQRHDQEVAGTQPTLATFEDCYPAHRDSPLSELQFACQRSPFVQGRELELFYPWLLASVAETSVRIDRLDLSASPFVATLIQQAADRPILKHLLYNTLLDYEHSAYKLFLLSEASTCDVALHHLSQRLFSSMPREPQPFHQYLDDGYRHLVCQQYLRSLGDADTAGDRLLEVVSMLGERCAWDGKEFASSFEYRFLQCLLEQLNSPHAEQLAERWIQHLLNSRFPEPFRAAPHHWYFVGFWLLERLEAVELDSPRTIRQSLKEALLSYYSRDFTATLEGEQRNLLPTVLFSSLPWHKLLGTEEAVPLLALSRGHKQWCTKLSFANEQGFSAASAVRQYLQVLMQIGRPLRSSETWSRVALRIVDIVKTWGFGTREDGIFLFDHALLDREYDPWPTFCAYTNLLSNEVYEDFVDQCAEIIPLDRLFSLLEHSSVIVRARQIQEIIAARDTTVNDDMGLPALEQAFLSACHAGHTTLAKAVMTKAVDFLHQERFATTKNPNILRARTVWQTYEYKWQLLQLLDSSQTPASDFANAVNQVQIPHSSRPYEPAARGQRQECERFRRYILAVGYCEAEPEKTVTIMEALYAETGQSFHAFQLFKGRLAAQRDMSDADQINRAITQFLRSVDSIAPEDMPTAWVVAVLESYAKLRELEHCEDFWRRLSPDQQFRIEILKPYCLALIAGGKPLVAQQLVHGYREFNAQSEEDLGLDTLVDELAKAQPKELSISRMIDVLNEDSQRSNVQLTKHYAQIIAKELEDFVLITGQGRSVAEYLKDAVLAVAKELQLRTKNLQIAAGPTPTSINSRITKEDEINDWFTSLFDQRMAGARIGLRDQKRGGVSPSGKSPGEIDGYVTSATNRRVAIFEAFRLFSADTNVIFDHLGKLAGYDQESLSPVFIVAYCDVADFERLVKSYKDLVAQHSYPGFAPLSDTAAITDLEDGEQLWLGTETRLRGPREVIFFHLLLNMRLQSVGGG